MAKKAKKPKKKPTTSTREWSPAQLAVQAAGRITGDLVNHLQKVRKAYLLVGQLLTEVRDAKHYVPLHHETMEEYAERCWPDPSSDDCQRWQSMVLAARVAGALSQSCP